MDLDDLLKEGRVADWTKFGPWEGDKVPGAVESGKTGTKEPEAGIMGSSMTKSDIPEPKLGSNAWIGLESEEGTSKEGVRGSENMGSCGIATLGQIWGSEMKVCGEQIEEMKGKTVSWKETSLEMKIFFEIKFNNL